VLGGYMSATRATHRATPHHRHLRRRHFHSTAPCGNPFLFLWWHQHYEQKTTQKDEWMVDGDGILFLFLFFIFFSFSLCNKAGVGNCSPPRMTTVA
jgi:hypothetical protein